MMNPWQQQVTNPWVIQALIGELAGAIARQHQLGHAGLGGIPFAAQPFQQVGSPFQSLMGPQPFIHQGSYGNGIGIGAGLPFATGVGNWSVPALAMV